MNQVKSSGFTKQMARNMFYGGSVFFILVFVALIFDSERRIPQRSNAEAITPAVIAGKKLWETRNCIGCHTLLGEGAYFAPELGNVYPRRGPSSSKLGSRRNPRMPRVAARCLSSISPSSNWMTWWSF
jgi:nitric oxide reductase subunit C